MASTETFNRMKQIVHSVLPEAKVILFGSRANGTETEESDWDLLILDKNAVDKKTRWAVYDALYPLSLELFAIINPIVANEEEWEQSPSWYSLRLSVSRNPTVA